MQRQHSGTCRPIARGRFRRWQFDRVEPVQAEGDLFGRHGSRPKHSQRRRRQVDDGRFQTQVGRPAVENQVDPAVQVGQDVLGAGGRDTVRAVGAGRGEGLVRRARSSPRAMLEAGTRRATVSRPAVTTSGIKADRGRTSVNGPGQNRWANRPAVSGQTARALLCLLGSLHVDDERIERGPALGLEDPGDGGRVGGDGTQSVDRLGREGDQPSS